MRIGRISEEEKNIIKFMRINNKSYGEIAHTLNCKKDRVRCFCNDNGLGGCRVDKYSLNTDEAITKFIKTKYPKYEYAGGYTTNEGHIYLMCKDCGHIFKYNAQITRPSRNRNIQCNNCKTILKEKKKVDIAARKESRQEENKRLAEQKELNKRIALKEKEITKICIECGKQFTTTKTREVCCSDQCKKKKMNNHKDRRLHKCEVVDYSITLSKLVKRDKGICHICGKKVDMNADSNSGRYGSIDHVKAIANGGNHTWDNVKLAHRHCNTIKRAEKYAVKGNGQLSMYI